MPHRALSIALCVFVVALVLIAVGIAVVVLNNARGLTQERQWTAQPGDIGSLWYSPDGTLFSTGDALRLWDPSTGQLKSTISATGGIMSLSPDGNVIAINTSRGRNKRTAQHVLDLWDLKTAAQLGSIDHLVWSAAFSPDGKTLATAIAPPIPGGNSTIEFWSLPAVLPLASHPRTSPVSSVCFSPDGKLLAIAERIAVELLDPTTGRSTRTLTGPANGFLGSLHFSPDGATLLAICSADPNQQGSLWAWDLSTGQSQQKVDFGEKVRVAFFSDDGKTLAALLISYTFSRHDRVEVWNTTTARRLGSVRVGRPWMSALALSPDGKNVAVGFQQPALRAPAPIGIWRVD